MFESHLGEIAALGAALCWTVSSASFESASRRVGSLPVNLIRLCIAFLLLSGFCLLSQGMLLPLDASTRTWFWLSLSGLCGIVAGDLCLFQAFVVIGSRISTLIMALVPPFTALIGWIAIGEILSAYEIIGMCLTVGGIGVVLIERSNEKKRLTLSRSITGILLALGGAVGQAGGLVLSKFGMGNFNAFAATQMRQIAAIVCFIILFSLLKTWPQVAAALQCKKALAATSLGAFSGPFLAVSLSMVSIQCIATGKAATLMATTPIFIILPAVIFFKEKVTIKEICGAVVAVLGVGVIFIVNN